MKFTSSNENDLLVTAAVEKVCTLMDENITRRNLLFKARLALIEVQAYLPTTYQGLVKEIDESGVLE